jgi:hypothetical protein
MTTKLDKANTKMSALAFIRASGLLISPLLRRIDLSLARVKQQSNENTSMGRHAAALQSGVVPPHSK